MNNIPYNQIISMKVKNNFIFGDLINLFNLFLFDFRSLYQIDNNYFLTSIVDIGWQCLKLFTTKIYQQAL